MSSHQRPLGLFAIARKSLGARICGRRRTFGAQKMKRPVTGRFIESVSVVPPFSGAGWWGAAQCPHVRDDGGKASAPNL